METFLDTIGNISRGRARWEEECKMHYLRNLQKYLIFLNFSGQLHGPAGAHSARGGLGGHDRCRLVLFFIKLVNNHPNTNSKQGTLVSRTTSRFSLHLTVA